MTKKILAKLICMVLMVNCLMGASLSSVSADEVTSIDATISYSGIKTMFASIETKLAAYSATDRYKMYNTGKVYFTTDEGIDALIGFVKNPATLPSSLSQLSELLDSNKNEIVFILNFIKSINVNNRVDALDEFYNKVSYGGLTNSQKGSLDSVYSNFVGESFRGILEQEHQITAEVLLTLVSCLKGSFVLTDISNDKDYLAIKSTNSSFADRLSVNVSKYFTKINGVEPSSGEKIIQLILDQINSKENTSMIQNYKNVFGALNMYDQYKSSSSSNNVSGGTKQNIIVPVTPTNPEYVPTVIPVPVPAPQVAEVVKKFDDVDTHWSSPYVSELVSRNIVRGYADGGFKPDQNMTREEVAVILVRALGLEERAKSVQDASFADGGNIGDWSKKAIALLNEMNILNGYEDGTFQPKNLISRQELAVLIARSLKTASKNVDIKFNDKNTIGIWAFDSVQKVYGLGIVKGYEDNSFNPSGDVTRSEVVTMIYNFMYTENLL